MYKLEAPDVPRLREDFRKLTDIKKRERSERPFFYFVVAALTTLGLAAGCLSLGDGEFEPLIAFEFHPWLVVLLAPWIAAFLALGAYYRVRLRRDALAKAAIHASWGEQGISFGEGLHGDGLLVFGQVGDGAVQLNPFHER